MKIAFVHQPWSIVHPAATGADSVVIWTNLVAPILARKGHEITCYSRAGDGLATREILDGVEHRRVSGPIDRYVKFALSKLDRWGLRDRQRPGFASAWAYRQFITNVARDARDKCFDVVHVHNFSQFLPVLRAALPSASVVLHMHCEWLTQLDRNLIARRLADASLVVAVSDFLARKIAGGFPEHAARIRRVWNGATQDVLPAPRGDNNKLRVLYTGRVSPEKGIHTLIEAFAIVAREVDNVELLIVGPERIVPFEMILPFCDDPKVLALANWFSGGYAAHLRTKIDQVPNGRARWSDAEVPHCEVWQHYRNADIFAFPSIWDEPFGMPLAEAMSAGLPCVATRGGAFPEIVVDGETGLLVERDDPRDLAAALTKLCRDGHLRRTLGAAGHRRATELFSWDCVAESLVNEYKRVRSE